MKLINLVTILLIITVFPSCEEEEQPLDREKFLGAYNLLEDCGNGSYDYDISIVESGVSENSIIINNLYALGGGVTAEVNDDMFIISRQVFGNQGLFEVQSGSGSIRGDVISLNFRITLTGGGSDVSNCASTGTRK